MNSLDELVDILKIKVPEVDTIATLNSLVNSYTGDDWREYEEYSLDSYHRGCVFSCSDFDLLVISWDCGQYSGVHDHPSKGCVLKVLSGELEERIYQNTEEGLKMCSTFTHKPNNVGYIDDGRGYHAIGNPSAKIKSNSLHLYSPGNYTPNFF